MYQNTKIILKCDNLRKWYNRHATEINIKKQTHCLDYWKQQCLYISFGVEIVILTNTYTNVTWTIYKINSYIYSVMNTNSHEWV